MGRSLYKVAPPEQNPGLSGSIYIPLISTSNDEEWRDRSANNLLITNPNSIYHEHIFMSSNY